MANQRQLVQADIASVCLRQMDEFNVGVNDIIMAQIEALIASLNTLKKEDRKRIIPLLVHKVKVATELG